MDSLGADLSITTISISKSLHNKLQEMSERLASRIGVRQTMAAVVSASLQALERELNDLSIPSESYARSKLRPNWNGLTTADVKRMIDETIAAQRRGDVS